MEYFTGISVCPQKDDQLGRTVEDLVAPGMRFQDDGKVKGKFFYVNGYEGFSKSPENQKGYFLPLKINATGKKLTIFKNGKQNKEIEDFANDPYLVLKVEPDQIWVLKVDGREIATLELDEAVFEEEKKEERNMKVGFFDPGSCGVETTGHIATLDKNTKTADAPLEIKNVFPKGASLINFIVKSSDDMAGPSSISIGVHGTEPNEYGTATATQGQTVKTEVEGFKQVLGKSVKIKADTDVTEGTVDIYATIIRLEV